jgi:hypothetical protein
MPFGLASLEYPKSQAEGLFHTSPGQRPGIIRNRSLLQAKGLRHRIPARFASTNMVCLGQSKPVSCPFRAQPVGGNQPRALPWAGMNHAFGVEFSGTPNRGES